ncbi:hypothetical protein RGQ29_030577 [Quercus rubra]|uniref:Transmembrane protein n=1 Tax=Quercus rubra TaxID=3512 RepID=A0AAN7EHX0_QUERU|nr:hypothetical protein RGQ29_030577 [Quercus rubra]
MDAKISMRIIMIAMLLFLFLSSATARVFAEPNNVAPEAKKKSSLQRIIVQMKTIGEMKFIKPGPVCVNECKRPTNP